MARELTLHCPCCDAELVIDVTAKRVVHHRGPRRAREDALIAISRQNARACPGVFLLPSLDVANP